ncbi:MAG: signal peptidase I [Nitrosopumilus sp.]|nr:signal peptidase I [Nitrosopumilaceae archaeon]UTY61561.1 MAG: signal peptidase I [Marine Group I thaumarchaeote]
MAKRSISKGVIKDIAIVVIAVIVIWIGLQAAFGTQNPFYVVASGSMIPALEVYDIIVIQGHEPFEEVQVGDIIVFDRPSDHNRVIVHRVESILSEDPYTVRTQGDANPSFIRGTDYPITEEEYIGKVAYVIPQVGYITQILKPPMNYIIIAIVIGIMIIKQFTGKKKEVEDIVSKETLKELSDIGKIEADSEYSTDIDKSEISEEKNEESKQNEEKSNEDKENKQ